MSTESVLPRSPDGAGRVQYVIDVVDAAARDLLTHRGVDDTLDLVVKGALQAVPGTAQAGVSLVSRSGTVTTCAPTDEVVRDLDEMQAQLREGPCVESIFEERGLPHRRRGTDGDDPACGQGTVRTRPRELRRRARAR